MDQRIGNNLMTFGAEFQNAFHNGKNMGVKRWTYVAGRSQEALKPLNNFSEPIMPAPFLLPNSEYILFSIYILYELFI